MLANLTIPAFLSRSNSVSLQQFPTAAPGSTVVLNPRFASWLSRTGLDSAPAIMALKGEIICGHPDRHVIRIVLPNGRILFLKKEHTIGSKVRFRNWRAGFGSISRCEREAITLQNLEEARLPCPQWLAYGKMDDGRAFLLVDNLAGGRDLTEWLRSKSVRGDEIRFVATRIGATLAEYHDAGYATPDLSAKHVFLCGPAHAVTVIDWQSAPAPGPVAWGDRVRSLARLHASLPDSAVPPRDRLALLRSYLRSCPSPKPRFADFVRSVQRLARPLRKRSSLALQSATGPSIRFVWLDDERVVTIPELAKHWPAARDEADAGQYRTERSFHPLGRLAAWIRGVPWRSKAAIDARMLAQLQSQNLPAPRLLAYGQTLNGYATSTSFLLTDRPRDAVPISAVLNVRKSTKLAVLKRCGQFLKQLHRSGVALRRNGESAILFANGGLLANAPDAFVRRKRTGFLAAIRDLGLMLNACGEQARSRTDRMALIAAYFGTLPRTGIRRYLVWRLLRGDSK